MCWVCNIMPEFPANDLLNAVAIGIVSGLASTGVNQVYKQLSTSPTEGVKKDGV